MERGSDDLVSKDERRGALSRALAMMNSPQQDLMNEAEWKQRVVDVGSVGLRQASGLSQVT